MLRICYQSGLRNSLHSSSTRVARLVHRTSSSSSRNQQSVPPKNSGNDAEHNRSTGPERLDKIFGTMDKNNERLDTGLKMGNWRLYLADFMVKNMKPDIVPPGYRMCYRSGLETYANFSMLGAGVIVRLHYINWWQILYIVHWWIISFATLIIGTHLSLASRITTPQFNRDRLQSLWAHNIQHRKHSYCRSLLHDRSESAPAHLLFRGRGQLPGFRTQIDSLQITPVDHSARRAPSTAKQPFKNPILGRTSTRPQANWTEAAHQLRDVLIASLLQQINWLR